MNMNGSWERGKQKRKEPTFLTLYTSTEVTDIDRKGAKLGLFIWLLCIRNLLCSKSLLCSTILPSHEDALALVTALASLGAAVAATPAIPRMDPTRQPLVDHMCAWHDAISLFRPGLPKNLVQWRGPGAATGRSRPRENHNSTSDKSALRRVCFEGSHCARGKRRCDTQQHWQRCPHCCCFVWLENKWPFRPLPGFRKKEIAKAWRQNLMIQQYFGWDAET